jgi:hypothetical protein
MNRMTKFNIAFGVAIVAFVALASTALAGSGTSLSGYGGEGGKIQATVTHGGTLPFTGLDLGLVAAVAVFAVVAGVAVRRLAQPRA